LVSQSSQASCYGRVDIILVFEKEITASKVLLLDIAYDLAAEHGLSRTCISQKPKNGRAV